jgi:hypothetical protein
MFLQVSAGFNFWKDALPIISNLATGSIVILFLVKKIGAMTVQIDALKGQIETQQGILNTTKLYFELFDLNKLKEYASISEEKAKMEARLIHQAEIDLLKEQDKVKRESLETAMKDASNSSEKIELLQGALTDRQTEVNDLQSLVQQSRSNENITRLQLMQVTRNLELTNLFAANVQNTASWGITYNTFNNIHPPLMPQTLSAVLKAQEVYDLLITHPFTKLNHDTTITLVRESLQTKYPHLSTAELGLQLHQYITEMAVLVVGTNVWNSNMH